MRVALLHYAAYPVVGGVEKVMYEHGRLMAAAGHQVRTIAGRGEQVDARVEFSAFPLADSQAEPVLRAQRALASGNVPAEFDALSDEIMVRLSKLAEGFDILIAHNVCSLNKNLALTAALHRFVQTLSAPRLVLWHHDLAWTTPRYAAELHEGFPWELLRRDWVGAVQVAVSRQRARELADLINVPIGQIRVIPNGIHPGEFLKLGAQAAGLVEDHGLLGADPLLLLPVRVTPRKNIELALRMMRELRGMRPGAKLLITGPMGPHNSANTGYLEALLAMRAELALESSVTFLTAAAGIGLSDETMNDLYRLADVLFLPSREEGFGIPLIEAALARVPVFCADIAPLQEIGKAEVEYFSLEAAPATLAQRISLALEGSKQHTLRKRVLQQYSWRRIYAEHIEPLLQEATP